MSIDWNQITNWVSLLTIFIAIIALIVQTSHSRRALQTDALLRSFERFESDKLRAFRRIAAWGLLHKGSTISEFSAIEEVLEFFGDVAFLINSKAINGRLAYNQYSWWLIRYWLCSKEYVITVRNFDPFSWVTLEKIANKLISEEIKEGYTDKDYSREKLEKFLEEESRLLIVDKQIESFVLNLQCSKNKTTIGRKTKKIS
jgi:hypothetical protein